MPSTAPDTSARTADSRNGTSTQIGRIVASVPTGSCGRWMAPKAWLPRKSPHGWDSTESRCGPRFRNCFPNVVSFDSARPAEPNTGWLDLRSPVRVTIACPGFRVFSDRVESDFRCDFPNRFGKIVPSGYRAACEFPALWIIASQSVESVSTLDVTKPWPWP